MNGNVRVCSKCNSESRQCITGGLVSSQANSFVHLASLLTQTVTQAYYGQTQSHGYSISETSYKILKYSVSLLYHYAPQHLQYPSPPPSTQSSLAIIRLVPSTAHSLSSLSLPAPTNPHHKSLSFIFFLPINCLTNSKKEVK